jgi:8-oxo-dGTP pyrophosphatase MutT (NUDIX family)
MTVQFCPGAPRRMGRTVMRWFRKPIPVRDSRFDSCILRSYDGDQMINTKNNQQITIGGAIVFRENRGKRQFLIVKTKDDGDWEIAKVIVRKGESSVRSVIRLTGEQGGMTARVLEEAGRSTGTTILNGKTLPQKYYYYILLQRGGPSELIGFVAFKWLELGDAIKKVTLKREKEMFRLAREVLKQWEKTHKIKLY